MFPNVRLLVAATLASIVMLICGFGMFAAFRVSHAPLLRPLVATASPQPLADNAASSPLAFAPSEPFDRRFKLGATDHGNAVEAFTRFLARRENIDSPSAASPAAPEPGAIAAKEQPTTTDTPKDAPAAKAAPITDNAPVASPPAATAPPPEDKARQAGAVTRPHRIRRAANEAATQDRQSNFSTTPAAQQWQTEQTRPAKARRRNVAAGKTDNTAAGSGGPFVGSPSQ